MSARRALVLAAGDDVATALVDLDADCEISPDGGAGPLRLRQAIPFGHKFAVRAVAAGDPVRKYGEEIGLATAGIAIGDHVHVHNLASRRGRGDLASGDGQ